MNSSFDARIEAQLRRAGRSLEELKQHVDGESSKDKLKR